MRLIPYSRVSTEEQASEGVSLDLQPQGMVRFAAMHGHELLPGIVDAGVSGSVPLHRRKGGAALIRSLAVGEAEGVIVFRLDRLFRDVLDGLTFFRLPRAQVVSCSELIDTSTPQGRLNLNILLATAQYERDVAAQRATANTDGLRAAGRVYGHVPFGCAQIGGQLYRCPRAWQQRERIVLLRHGGYSLATIRRLLHDERVHAPNGGDWWSKSTLVALVESHALLTHLPELPAETAPATAATPDSDVSRGGSTRERRH